MLQDFYEPYVRLLRCAEPDGCGGERVTWTDGETFMAFVCGAGETRMIAGREEHVTFPRMTHEQGILLGFGERVRRVKDGRLYAVDGDDTLCRTPGSSRLDAARVNLKGVTGA